ncbi:methyltransferase family protein [Chitinibacteraceae bacterium HSL-7]
MKRLELRILPLALVALVALLMAALAYAFPAAMPLPYSSAIAAAVALTGIAVALAGVRAFRAHKTTVNPMKPHDSSALVASGIYRHTRNPMYLGFLLVLVAWGIHLASWVALLMLPTFVAYMNRFQIIPEERALTARFGAAFAAYCQSVRRWL